jgi:hypothetical protein
MNFPPGANLPPEEPRKPERLVARPNQLSLRFLKGHDPSDHFSKVVHNQFGVSLICQIINGNVTRQIAIFKKDLVRLNELLNPVKFQTNYYYSPSEFKNPRRIAAELVKVNCLAIDLDKKLFVNSLENQPYNWVCHVNRLAAIDVILRFIESRDLPLPKLIVWTGNGFHLYWLLLNESYHCAKYWSLLQKDLIELLRPIGADPACCDVTRLLRLAGTRHANGNISEFYELQEAKERWKLREIYKPIYSAFQTFIAPKKIQQFPTKPPKKQPTQRRILKPNPGWKKIESYFSLVIEDLIKIAEAQPNQKIPKGWRNFWVYCVAVALAYLCTNEIALVREILSLGKTFTDLPEKQIFSNTSTIRKKANQYYRLNWQYLNGLIDERPPEPRYKLSVKKVLSLLDFIIPVSLYHDLRAIVPYQLKAQRKFQQNHNPDPRLKRNQRYKTNAAQRRAMQAYARHLHDQGLSYPAIAEKLGVHCSTIYRWLKSHSQ